jgi:hypothetical protein
MRAIDCQGLLEAAAPGCLTTTEPSHPSGERARLTLDGRLATVKYAYLYPEAANGVTLGANTVKVLAEAGVLEPGMTLKLGIDTLAARWRAAAQAFLAQRPEAGLADWTGQPTGRSFRWHLDGQVYSLTALTKALLDQAGADAPTALPGPDFWLLPDGRPLYKASRAIRAQAD